MIATDKLYQFDADEWLTQNMHRNYPLADDQVVKSIAGAYLPSSFLADMTIHTLPGDGAGLTSNFYLSSVINSGGVITLTISYYDGSGTDFICARVTGIDSSLQAGDTVASRTFKITAATDDIPSSYSLLKSLNGQVILGTCQDLASDSYELDYDHARISESCIVQSIAGLTSITFVTASGSNITFDSDFIIQADDGIDFSYDSENNILKIMRVQTAAEKAAKYTSVDAVVSAVLTQLGNPIKSINGVSPTSAGNFVINGDDCLEVSAGDASLTLSNTCAKPCCSESTPADVTSALQTLEDAKSRLLTYFETLSSNVNSLQSQLATLISANKK